MNTDFDPLIPGQELQGQFKIGLRSAKVKEYQSEQNESQRVISFEVEAGLRYVPVGISESDLSNEELVAKSMVAEVTAIFLAEYLLLTKELPDAAILEEFGRHNAVYHVWPYWREYSQNSCTRMNLPITVMPMLVITSAQPTPGPDQDLSTHAPVSI